MDANQILQDQQARILLLEQLVRQQSRPKPSLPDPEKFNGQSMKFDTWLPSIKAKLRVDGSSIGDSTAQFYYVYLNLDSSVQAMVLPQLAIAEELQSWDYMTILNQLARVYENPNKIQEAEDRLLSLKQGSDSITAYIAKYERILFEARGSDWPDSTKISTFRKGLNSTLRNRLNQQLNLPRSYAEFIQIVQRLAGHNFDPIPQPPSTNKDPMELGAMTTVHSTSKERRLWNHQQLKALEQNGSESD